MHLSLVTSSISLISCLKRSSSWTHLHPWHLSSTSVPWVASRFWSSPEPKVWTAFLVCLGTHIGSERLWDLHLHFYLWLSASVGSHHVVSLVVMESFPLVTQDGKNSVQSLPPFSLLKCPVWTAHANCHTISSSHASPFADPFLCVPGLLCSLLASFVRERDEGSGVE